MKKYFVGKFSKKNRFLKIQILKNFDDEKFENFSMMQILKIFDDEIFKNPDFREKYFFVFRKYFFSTKKKSSIFFWITVSM